MSRLYNENTTKGGVIMKWNRWTTMIVIGAIVQAIGEVGKVISSNVDDEKETE